jgi:hypothetical protein
MKNILKSNGLVQLIVLFVMIFMGNAQGAEKKMSAQELKKELIAADWSQAKIKELREKTGSTVQMKYDRVKGKTIYTEQHGPLSYLKTALDDILIDHYAQKIYAALQTVPVSERVAWADELGLILDIGLKNFLADGKARYEAGKITPILLMPRDGSETSVYGTKYQALQRVKKETNNFTTIPFNDSAYKMLPVVFFNSLLYGDIISPMKL